MLNWYPKKAVLQMLGVALCLGVLGASKQSVQATASDQTHGLASELSQLAQLKSQGATSRSTRWSLPSPTTRLGTHHITDAQLPVLLA